VDSTPAAASLTGDLLYFGAGIVVLVLWIRDTREGKGQGFPGAFWTGRRPLLLAAVGGLALTLLETVGEGILGISAEQGTLPAGSLLALLGAAVVEEVVFRGYLVVMDRGRAALVGSIVLFSALFALLHPYLWSWEDGTLVGDIRTKTVFTTVFLFLGSLWFYAVRFSFGNNRHSLLPCFVAHATANASVWVVKLLQGHLTWGS
jgi:membrane protease YdiL (CAAX protease family)